MRKHFVLPVAAGVAVAMGAAPAVADPADEMEPDGGQPSAPSDDTELLTAIDVATADEAGAVAWSASDVSARVADGELAASVAGSVVAMNLPDAVGDEQPRRIRADTTVVDSPDGSFSIASQPLGVNAFRALIVIDDPSAPTEYRFEFDLPDGVSLRQDSSGAIEVLDELGDAIGVVTAPWAEDAAGDIVRTTYRLEPNAIVQTVEHAGATYPVVADPSFQGDCGIITCTVRFDRAQT